MAVTPIQTLAAFLLLAALTACGAPPTPEPTTTPAPTATPRSVPTPLPTTPLSDDVLLVFNREGGFAYTNVTLTVWADGTVLLEGDPQKGDVKWQASADQLASLNIVLNDPGFAHLPYEAVVACMDCYVYTITATTPQGVKLIQVDDADLSNNPPALLQQAIDLLTGLMESAP